MNRKAILINVIILGLLAGFIFMSITIYHLVPAIGSGIDILMQAVKDLIGTIRR